MATTQRSTPHPNPTTDNEITSSSGGPSGGPSNESMPVPTNNVGAIVAPIVVSVFIMILIATVVIIAIVVKFKKSAKKGLSSPAHGKPMLMNVHNNNLMILDIA